jgi:hypothetical protein
MRAALFCVWALLVGHACWRDHLSKGLWLILVCAGAVFLAGCGTVNSQFAAGLYAVGSDYSQVKKNLQTQDDMALQAWTDTSCAITLGALQRAGSTTGNANVTRAALATCPIADVGVIAPQMNGQITVQTNSIQSTQQTQTVAPVSANLPTPAPVVAIHKPIHKIMSPVHKSPTIQPTNTVPIAQPIAQPAIIPQPVSNSLPGGALP